MLLEDPMYQLMLDESDREFALHWLKTQQVELIKDKDTKSTTDVNEWDSSDFDWDQKMYTMFKTRGPFGAGSGQVTWSG